jgi:RNA-directed DNA polymerase
MGHIMEQPNPDDRLLEKILSRDNLITAWKRVKANKGAPGIDDMTIEELPAFARRYWHEILEAAIPVALSPKGPWHLARTLATQSGMITPFA